MPQRKKSVSLVVDSLRAGGAERVAVLLTDELARRGYSVHLLTFKGEETDFFPLPLQVKRSVIKWRGIFRVLGFLRELRERLKSADVIISFMDQANVLTLLAAPKTCILISERNNPRFTSLYRKLRGKKALIILLSFFKHLLYKRASYIVVQTERGMNFFPSVLRPKVKAIPNPLCLPVGEGKLSLKNPCVVAIGRLTSQKNFQLLINSFYKAVEVFGDWKLYIFGEGEEKEILQQLIKDLKLEDKAFLMGRTEDVYGALKEADIFALSSLAEGQPVALGEAMALGKAVVATDCPTGPAELIESGVDGLLVENNNQKDFTGALLKLMGDLSLREELGRNAKEKAKRFSIENITDEWEKLFNRAD